MVDGVLDDACWGRAGTLGPFQQVDPALGEPPSFATEVRVLHDGHALYVGVRCRDPEPDRLVVTTRARDGDLEDDDRIELLLDTFGDGRNAYFFEMNAAGAKGDALVVANGDEINDDWDGLWYGRTSVDAEGWCAEFAIPFRTVGFHEDADTWGFNVERYVGRLLEQSRWTNISRDYEIENVFRAGRLTGLTDIEHGIGLDVVPFLVARDGRLHDADGTSNRSTTLRPGLDLFYRIRPGLTLSLTVDTDFSGTEVDERQVNLTRFPLFFPEKRDFFLEDAGLFRFGIDGMDDGEDADLIPFFSRTIGLDEDGAVVPIEYGGKVTGRAGAWGVGVLDVRTGRQGKLDRQDLSVVRLTRNVGEQSVVGGLVTHGNPAGDGHNAVFGVDGTLRSTMFDGDRDLVTTAYWLHSDSEGVDRREAAYGVDVTAPGDLWSWSVGAQEIQENFDAALGFVPRGAIRTYSASVAWDPRPEDDESVRQYGAYIDTELITGTDGDMETLSIDVQPFGVEWQSGDELSFGFEVFRDQIFEDFDITDDVVIPPDDYNELLGWFSAETSGARPLSVWTYLEAGGFYGGDIVTSEVGCEWRPNALFSGELEFERNDVRLPDGDFTTHVAILRATETFSPRLSWAQILQWDDDSDSTGLQARLRWIPEPGRELIVVLDDTFGGDPDPTVARYEGLTTKVSWTQRF